MNARANEVITRDEALTPMVSTATSLLQVIQQAATNPAVDIDKMERLMAMHERVVARDAEAAFNTAMRDCQAEMRPIAADAENPQTRSKYATHGKLDGALRPVYTKHGFSISYDEGDSPKPEHVRVVAYVAHVSGHTRTYHKDIPADGKGAKGGDVMTKTHASGAADSYGKRYLLKNIWNVAIGEEDRDGNAAPGMTREALDGWVKKIEAATTKPAAKEIWQAAVKEAKQLRDREAADVLKAALIAHAEFIDGAK
jgi:hypothetical protein